MFKRHRYPKDIILQAVYFKSRFSLSYRDIEELFRIRGVQVDHATLQRWVFKFSPMIERNAHRRKFKVGDSWRMDETYVRVSGKDRYLYRAVDKSGATVDFLLTKRRMKGSAQKFLNKVLSNNPKPRVINIDKSNLNILIHFMNVLFLLIHLLSWKLSALIFGFVLSATKVIFLIPWGFLWVSAKSGSEYDLRLWTHCRSRDRLLCKQFRSRLRANWYRCRAQKRPVHPIL